MAGEGAGGGGPCPSALTNAVFTAEDPRLEIDTVVEHNETLSLSARQQRNIAATSQKVMEGMAAPPACPTDR